MFQNLQKPTLPGLLILGTDTDIGKTLVTCCIANALKNQNKSVGVFKPFASGCNKERGHLIADDAVAIAHYANTPHPIPTINPIAFEKPLSPAIAAKLLNQTIDIKPVNRALNKIQSTSDLLLIESVGGLHAPLDPTAPQITNLDMALALGYPTIIVTRPNLGTLNHTAMTVDLLRQHNIPIAGLVVNRFIQDPYANTHDQTPQMTDTLMSTNLDWLCLQNNLPILAVLPDITNQPVIPHQGKIPGEILDLASHFDWQKILKRPINLPPRSFGPATITHNK